MMDNFSIERVWEDEHMFEIEVVAQSEYICAKARTYLPLDGLDDLANELERFYEKTGGSYFWEAGECSNVCSYISLLFACEDMKGHVRIEVYMEINDQLPKSKHSCRMVIYTELGQVCRFGSLIHSLSMSGTGKKVTLNEIEE